MVAPLDVPVGFDGYSYGLRDVTGQKVHMSRPRPFMSSFGTGDVIGMHISLPPPPPPETGQNPPLFPDRTPNPFPGQLSFQQPPHTANKKKEDLINPFPPPQ